MDQKGIISKIILIFSKFICFCLRKIFCLYKIFPSSLIQYLLVLSIQSFSDIANIKAKYIKKKDGIDILMKIENGKLKPAKALQYSVASMLRGNEEFYLIDEQKVAYETIKKLVSNSLKESNKVNGLNQKYTIIGLDLDHLKRINDTFGHSCGDIAIKTVADVIKKNARSIDIAARMGGEEFNILLPGVDHQGGMIAAERIRKAIEEAGGTMPENLPTPDKSLKELEKNKKLETKILE